MIEAHRRVSGQRWETGKSDRRRVAERDGGSVHTALEGKLKPRLTGEPVRIDRPISSCQRKLIWHQQSLYVKKEKGRPGPRVWPHACVRRCNELRSFNGRHAHNRRGHEDTRMISISHMVTLEWLFCAEKGEKNGGRLLENCTQLLVNECWQLKSSDNLTVCDGD